MARRTLMAGLVLAIALAGCGDGPEQARRAAESELVQLPASVVQRCAELAPRRAIGVLCPPRLPRARWYVRHQSLRGGRLEYLINLDTKPSLGDPFHVLAGGRRRRFSLKTDGDRWPVDAGLGRDLGLVGALPLKPGERGDAEQRPVRLTLLRRAKVSGHPALLLEVADYPTGGVHGGHLAAVWNQGRDGYALSLHFSDRSLRTRSDQEALLLSAAAAMSRSGAADAS